MARSWKQWFGKGALYIGLVPFVCLFLGRAFFKRGRATHTNGVGGRGWIRIVDDPSFPECDFFRPGRRFPLTIRHGTALQSDDGCKNLRSIALKFSHESFDSPLDLIMNTGKAMPFWTMPSFLVGVACAAFQRPGRWVYQHLFPLARRNVIIGSRRAPETYTQMEYYAGLAFGLHARDGVERLCRFRIIPHDRGPETGLPDETDIRFPWRDKRRPEESKCRDHLIREFRNRIRDGETPRYWLQMQTHVCSSADSNRIYSIAHEWEPETHPWMDVGEITIDSLLPSRECEALRFRVDHQPADLSIPEADHPLDYRCIGWMRRRIYPMDQAWRRFWQRSRTNLGYGHAVQWDKPAVEGWSRFRKPYTQTWLIPLTESRQEEVRAWMDTSYPRWYSALPFVDSLHYLRICVLPIGEQSHLVINTVHDGDVRDHLDDLLRVEGDLFAHLLLTIGAPGDKLHELREWLIAHGESSLAFHVGGVRCDKRSIQNEERLRDALHLLLDDNEATLRAKPAAEIQAFLRRAILEQADSGLPAGPRPRLSLPAKLRKGWDLFASLLNPVSGLLAKDVFGWARERKSWALRWTMLVGLILWQLYVFLPTCLFLLLIRWRETSEPEPPEAEVEAEALQRLETTENMRLQNNLTMYAPVQSSRWRRWILRRILAGAEKGTRHIWNEGRLTGIDTIHFARFLTLDEGRWMLFMSDFDGSWDRYLQDFLTVGGRAVVPIWSNLDGCPKTRWLFHPTPGFAGRFKRFTRSRQVRSLLWFSAYPNLSMANIVSNARLRDGLFKESMSDEEAEAWLEHLNA